MLLTVDNAKTTKGEALGYLTGIMYLAPHKQAGVGNVCPESTAGCRAGCLGNSGRLRMETPKKAAIRRTLWYYSDRPAFLAQLVKEIRALIRKAERENLIPVVRLNGTSDLLWETVKYQGTTLLDMFSDIQFYDYTKRYGRLYRNLPANYYLTASYSEERHDAAMAVLADGVANLAVVLRDSTKPNRLAKTWDVPNTWNGIPMVNGDAHDLRFLDNGPGNIVGLKAKGFEVWKDSTGFVWSV